MVQVFSDLGLPYRVDNEGTVREFLLFLTPDDDYRSASAERERVADVASLRSVLRPA